MRVYCESEILLNSVGLLYLIFINLNAHSVSQNVKRSFNLTKAEDGTLLCVNDTPAAVYDAFELQAIFSVSKCIPSVAICSRLCAQDRNCISFNWRRAVQLCEIFYIVSENCPIITNCWNYQVDNQSCLLGNSELIDKHDIQ